jgi:hypothetical protein
MLLVGVMAGVSACRATSADVPTSTANHSQRNASQSPGQSPTLSTVPKQGAVFGNGWKLAPTKYKDVNHKWKYKIRGIYPQVINSHDPRALGFNQEVKRGIAEQFSYATAPDPKDFQISESLFLGEDPLEMADFDYEIMLATEELVSVKFNFEAYSRGAAHPVHGYFTVNYEAMSGRGLKLGDIFKPDSDYLTVISRSCAEKIGVEATKGSPWADASSPKEKNFEHWNVTKEGVVINFDQCVVWGCAGGTLTVIIPYSILREYLNPSGAVFQLAT